MFKVDYSSSEVEYMKMNDQIEDNELCKELDKGIADMEEGRVTPHDESMKILWQRYLEYVRQ